MEKKFNFVFITTNLKNGKRYVGEHATDDLNCWHTKDYLGSGLYLKHAVKEYGKENFKRKDLEFFLTNEQSFNAQEKYINLYKTHVSEGGYNISWKGGHKFKGSVSEETKNKISNSRLGIKYSSETITKMSNYAKNRTKEHIQKISIGLKGKAAWNKNKKLYWIFNEDLQKTKMILEKDIYEKIKDGWKLGRKYWK